MIYNNEFIYNAGVAKYLLSSIYLFTRYFRSCYTSRTEQLLITPLLLRSKSVIGLDKHGHSHIGRQSPIA